MNEFFLLGAIEKQPLLSSSQYSSIAVYFGVSNVLLSFNGSWATLPSRRKISRAIAVTMNRHFSLSHTQICTAIIHLWTIYGYRSNYTIASTGIHAFVVVYLFLSKSLNFLLIVVVMCVSVLLSYQILILGRIIQRLLLRMSIFWV